MFDVAAVLINFNSSEFTVNCINSIIEQTAKNTSMQIIVVDNASEKDDLKNLENRLDSVEFPHLTLLKSKINTGFGGGNMLGVKSANSKYLAFINNDTILKNDCVNILMDFMKLQKDAGVCGPQAFTEDGNILPTIDHFPTLGKTIFGRKALEIINPKKYPKRKKLYKNPIKGQFVAGSFMFLRSIDFKEIGGFDTNIFLYHEETDLCKRLLKINKYAYLVPKGEFMHFHGASTKRSLNIKKELKISLLYVIRKHYGYMHYLILLIYLQITYFFKSIFKPEYWSMFNLLLQGAPLSKSMKPIEEMNTNDQ